MTLAEATTSSETDTDFYAPGLTMRQTHQIHTSEMRSFLSCRRRWNWSHREGYVSHSSPKPLELGIAFHKGMEVVYDPDKWSTTTPEQKLQAAIDMFTTTCEAQRYNFLRTTNQDHLLSADGDDYAERIELGIGMLKYYCLEIHPHYDNWFKPVMVEVAFQVPIEFEGISLRCSADDGFCGQLHSANAPVTFDGRIDAIIEDIVNGGYFIWDHKSAKQIRKDDRLLQLDPQVRGYAWAALVQLDLDIRGFLYVEYRKDYPRKPEMLSRRYKGRSFSTNKDAPTDYENFINTIKRYDATALQEGCYDEYLAHLKSKDAPQFHKRFPIVQNRKQLHNAGQVIYDIAREMTMDDLNIYPQVGMSCGGCAYYIPCLSKMNGEDYSHSLQTSFQKVK